MSENGVLVVDDDAHLRESLCEIFDISDIEAYGAGSGAQALAEATARKPAVVLTDFQLPDSDGYRVCQALKAALGPSLFVIVMTGRILTQQERAIGDAAGVNEYLPKPFDIAQLCRRISGIIKERSVK